MSNVIRIGTDGGCRNNQKPVNEGGWGVVLDFNGTRKYLYGGKRNTTNNQMELTSVIKAFQAIKNKDYLIEIYADPAYVVNCLKNKWYVNWEKNGWKNAKKQPVENKEVWVCFLDLYRSFTHQPQFIKVAGHTDHEYNIIADALANMGMDRIQAEQKLNEFEDIATYEQIQQQYGKLLAQIKKS